MKSKKLYMFFAMALILVMLASCATPAAQTEPTAEEAQATQAEVQPTEAAAPTTVGSHSHNRE